MGNSVAAGFVAGGVLARNSGPKGALLGGLGFAAFSAVIDFWMKRETPEYFYSSHGQFIYAHDLHRED